MSYGTVTFRQPPSRWVAGEITGAFRRSYPAATMKRAPVEAGSMVAELPRHGVRASVIIGLTAASLLLAVISVLPPYPRRLGPQSGLGDRGAQFGPAAPISRRLSGSPPRCTGDSGDSFRMSSKCITAPTGDATAQIGHTTHKWWHRRRPASFGNCRNSRSD